MRAIALVLAATSVGCIHTFAPVPAPPPPMEPPRSDRPVPPGYGRIFVDVADGPVFVSVVEPVEVTETLNDQTVTSEVLRDQGGCTSPCILDLRLGAHLLAFPMRGSGGVDLAHVVATPRPTVYRHALGWRQKGGAGFVLGLLGVSFGGMSVTTGAALLPVGLVKGSEGMTLAGEITLGVGAVLTVVGIWAMASNPSMVQAGGGAQYEVP
jgi:hypothetical protein